LIVLVSGKAVCYFSDVKNRVEVRQALIQEKREKKKS
jgi:hypothetical protein